MVLTDLIDCIPHGLLIAKLNALFGSPQGSISGLILFIIFIADLFFINNDIDFASYADDTTPYVCGQNFSEVINFLESNVTNVFK